MSYQLNKKIRDLQPYDPIQGDYKIRLDANESFYAVPQEVKSEIMEKLEEVSFNRYPDPLAAETASSFAEYYGLNQDNVTVFNGSDESIFVIMSAFVMKGDKVMTLSHDFSMYKFYAYVSEAEVNELPKNDDLSVNIDSMIETANREDIKLIIFSNPCNPTSLGVRREEILRLITSVNALVVVDEAYMDFWDQSILDTAGNYDNLIVLKTCSKAFGMAAARLGFTVADKRITTALRAVKSPYNSNTLTQAVGSVVYKHKDIMLKDTEDIISQRRSLQAELQRLLDNDYKIYDSCTNFVYIATDKAREIYEFMLGESIAIRCFGTTHLRITTGSADENKQLIKALKKYLGRE